MILNPKSEPILRHKVRAADGSSSNTFKLGCCLQTKIGSTLNLAGLTGKSDFDLAVCYHLASEQKGTHQSILKIP